MNDRSLKTVCQSSSLLDSYLEEKAANHNCYKTYSNSDRIQAWLDTGFFYLDDGSRWNDVHDRSTFNSEDAPVKRFGRCFSFSRSESVAMWMLYGGMRKKGAMLEFSKKQMRTLIESTDVVQLGNWEDNVFVPVITLRRGEFSLQLKDILYVGESDKGIYLRRSSESVEGAPYSPTADLRHSVKTISWSYENECRLILTVTKDILPGKSVSSVRISLAPLLSAKETTPAVYRAPNYQGVSTYRPSQLSGEIDWDLCWDCPRPPKDQSAAAEIPSTV